MDTKSFEDTVLHVNHCMPPNAVFVVIVLDEGDLNMASNLDDHTEICRLLSGIVESTPTSKTKRSVTSS